MGRYLLISTVIVVGIAVLVAGWANRDLIRVKIASVYARAHAKAGGASSAQGTVAPLSGDAPWALSALPECLMQISESSGSPDYVRAHLPAGATAILPPAVLAYADCKIEIVADEAYVVRGSDRLRIPPRAHFYRAKGLLAVIRETPQKAQLRVYEPAQR